MQSQVLDIHREEEAVWSKEILEYAGFEDRKDVITKSMNACSYERLEEIDTMISVRTVRQWISLILSLPIYGKSLQWPQETNTVGIGSASIQLTFSSNYCSDYMKAFSIFSYQF